MSSSRKSVERGQSITFRVPSDTPDHILKQLTRLKEEERRNFSSRIAQFVMDGVSETLSKEKEMVTIPLPKPLTKEQRSWMKHEHSEALIGSILYQLMLDPMRATTLLATMNSNAYDIDDALYLQEEEAAASNEEKEVDVPVNNPVAEIPEFTDDDLDDLDLDSLQGDLRVEEEDTKEEDEDDMLDDFFSRMNR
ncbi:hypothetical protein QRD89_18180 [Halobacillus sp. ACCC02827]|uniref:hypothetical protein n=1 Tax=unclassified Halobacillus TaxID=2636472 RepID=UPI000780257D|nr:MULTISPECIES: hypothetical protein [unclassified Halobacillus]WJE15625.1 hypothetical protein QRD89_18180 [Halobacillus sp. ACCC02827]